MSGLGYLARLLDGAAVKWVPLGDVVKVLRGKRLTKGELSEDEEYPVFHGGLEPLGYYGEANRPAKSVMVINVGASAGTVGFSEVDFWSSDGCFTLAQSAHVDSKFLYHFLIGQEHHIKGKVRVAGIPTLDSFVVEKILIPIPSPEDPRKSLAIQAEIVRILDAFTALTAELTAELTARRTQYNHYRNQLLRFDGADVEWRALGDVARVRTGQSINKNIIAENPGEYPVINSGREPLGYFDQWNTDNDPIGITSRGAGVGSVTWREGKYFRGNLNYSATIKEPKSMDVRFLYHILEQFQPEIKQLCTFDGIPALNAGNLVGLNIPVPPFDEQKRIANILDKFDTITTSLSEGLPREIALRQKQYEYYRNLLLSFPKGNQA